MGLRTLLILASFTVVVIIALVAAYVAAGAMTSRVYRYLGEAGPSPSSPRRPGSGPQWFPSYIAVSYSWMGNGLRVDIAVQRPNPCYSVELAGYRASGRTLIVELAARGPAPGTYCIEVVPPPFKSTVFFTVDRGDYTLLIVVNGRLAKKIPVTP